LGDTPTQPELNPFEPKATQAGQSASQTGRPSSPTGRPMDCEHLWRFARSSDWACSAAA